MYYRLNICISPNSYVEVLSPNAMPLGDGNFGGNKV